MKDMGLESNKQSEAVQNIDSSTDKKRNNEDLMKILEDLIPSLQYLNPQTKMTRDVLLNEKNNETHLKQIFEELSIIETLLEKSSDSISPVSYTHLTLPTKA